MFSWFNSFLVLFFSWDLFTNDVEYSQPSFGHHFSLCQWLSSPLRLRFSNLTDECCPALAAVLSSTESFVKELDLGYNNISDSGVKTLVEGLNNQNCRLRTLSLQGCEVTSQGIECLATALSQSQRLRQLDLSRNNIGDNGLQHLSNGLRSPECQLLALK